MANVFFGFAVADSMFSGSVSLSRRELTPEQARELVQKGVAPCLNSSHAATIAAMTERFGISVEIPPPPAPQVRLNPGDSLIVMSVRGLPRLDDKRHEYTREEIDRASFVFSLWTVA